MSLDEVPEIEVIVDGCRVIVTSEGIVFTGPTPILDDAVETLRETLKAYATLGIRADELEDEVKRLREALSRIVEAETAHNLRGDVLGHYPSGMIARCALKGESDD